jgi:hypothetical protein
MMATSAANGCWTSLKAMVARDLHSSHGERNAHRMTGGFFHGSSGHGPGVASAGLTADG